MSENNGPYAVKKRKKPVQKTVKPPLLKTNPSKRHRDRLNVELDRLASLLPFSEDIRSRLDKLSVLRLSVGYLKAKSCLQVPLQKSSASLVAANSRNVNPPSLDGVSFSEGELLLKALNGFVLAMMADGMLFYASPTIQDFLGFHQSDVVQQSIYNLIHKDDRETFRRQLHFSELRGENGSCSDDPVSSLPQNFPPETSSLLERSFCCRLRCLLDNTSGFLALHFNGRLKCLSLPANGEAAGGAAAAQLALFAIATAVEPPSVMEIRMKTFIFQTKHSMDFAPMGVDSRGSLILGYSEMELVTRGSGYQFLHAADMMYCSDNHLRMIKTGNTGFTYFRLLTKAGHWLWVQASARVVFKNGRPDFIIARQKALTNEEGEEHLHQRRQQLPFNLSTGESVLYNTWMESFSESGPPDPEASSGSKPTTESCLDPASLLGSLHRQDHSLYSCTQQPSPQTLPPRPAALDLEHPQSSFEQAFWDSHALLSVPGQTQAPEKSPISGDLMAEAMIETLEQIIADIENGGMEGCEIKETELRDWENTLVRKNNERQDALNDLSQILANDVFSYVEEALVRDFGGPLQGSGVPAPAHDRPLWPSGSWRPRWGEQLIPSQSCSVSLPDSTQQSWHPPVNNTDSIDQSVEHHLRITHRLQGSSSCRQQQPQSLHCHTLPSSSHVPGSLNSTVLLHHHPQMQTLPGSCGHGNREGHISAGAAAPAGMNRSLLLHRGQPLAAHPNGNAPFTLSHPHTAACTDVGNISSLHLNGDRSGREMAPSVCWDRNASTQSSFACWQEDVQIPHILVSSVAEPSSFSVHPTESVNLSQDSGTELCPGQTRTLRKHF